MNDDKGDAVDRRSWVEGGRGMSGKWEGDGWGMVRGVWVKQNGSLANNHNHEHEQKGE